MADPERGAELATAAAEGRRAARRLERDEPFAFAERFVRETGRRLPRPVLVNELRTRCFGPPLDPDAGRRLAATEVQDLLSLARQLGSMSRPMERKPVNLHAVRGQDGRLIDVFSDGALETFKAAIQRNVLDGIAEAETYTITHHEGDFPWSQDAADDKGTETKWRPHTVEEVELAAQEGKKR
jgi:hypothetical protein